MCWLEDYTSARFERSLRRSRSSFLCCRPQRVSNTVGTIIRYVHQYIDRLRTEKPEYVFLAAAKVGGIIANSQGLADFMYHNMMLEMNVIHAAWQNGVKKLEFLGSSCICPRLAPQPMPESCLLTSALEPTNEAYALAKNLRFKILRIPKLPICYRLFQFDANKPLWTK